MPQQQAKCTLKKVSARHLANAARALGALAHRREPTVAAVSQGCQLQACFAWSLSAVGSACVLVKVFASKTVDTHRTAGERDGCAELIQQRLEICDSGGN